MDQRQFEQAVEHIAKSERVERLVPGDLSRRFGLPVKEVERQLDRMVTNGTLELDSDDDGNLFYFMPGVGSGGVFTPGSTLGPTAPPPASAAAPPGTGAPGQPPAYTAPGYGPGPYGAPGQPPYGQPGPYGAQPPYGGAPTGRPGQPGVPPQGSWPAGSYSPPYVPPTYGYGAQPPPPAYGQQRTPWGPPTQAPGQQGGWPGAQQPTGGWAGQPGVPYGAPPAYGQSPYGAPGAYPGQVPYGHNALVPIHDPYAQQRSPAAAAVLSMFFPGAGQLYNGQVGKGLAFFFAFFIGVAAFPLMFIPYFWSIMDAHNTSRRLNTYGMLPP